VQISIIGGGRWARTIATVLCSFPSRSDDVVIHTLHNAAGIAAWLEGRRLGDRLRIETVWPDFGIRQDRPDAVIVANRARDHSAAALPALRAGVPVLVEKPMAFPQHRIATLREAAEATETLLAGSNVFLFARYFEAYANLIATLGRSHRLSFTWTDGPADIRRGEVKSYDAAVTLFDDVLPHVVTMLESLKFGDLSLEAVAVRRGGADVTIEARSNGRSLTLNLARNGRGRQRLIEVETDAGTATLDFLNEPGFVRAPGFAGNGDPFWDSSPRPLASMLTAFLAATEGQPLDVRLSPANAMAAGTFADEVRGRYVAHQIRWLGQRLGEPLDAPLRYALKELAGDNGPAETIADMWSAMETVSHLKSFLSQSRLLCEAGYDYSADLGLHPPPARH
jgi:predicted dehydrogenase